MKKCTILLQLTVFTLTTMVLQEQIKPERTTLNWGSSRPKILKETVQIIEISPANKNKPVVGILDYLTTTQCNFMLGFLI